MHSMDTNGETPGIPTSNNSSAASHTQNHSPFLSGREAIASGNEPLVLLQLDVEGWTAAKRELIQKMTREMKVTVVLIQEAHQTMTDQLKLYGFTLAGHIPREHHGIAAFVRSSISFSLVGYSNAGDPTQWITITINGICILNVYHPPPAVLNVSLLPSASDQCIISRDFNCRHENWGYPDSNQNGNLLADWSCTDNLHTLYDPKQPASFQSEMELWNNPRCNFLNTYEESYQQGKSSNSFLTLSTALH